MLCFFYGENHKSSLEEVNTIIARFKGGGVNRIPYIIDCEETTAAELDMLLNSRSLFGDIQLFIIKHILNARHLHNFFSNKIESLKNSPNVVVIWERNMPEKSELFTLLIKNARHKEFSGAKKVLTRDNLLYNLADSWATRSKNISLLTFHKLLSRGVTKERIFWTLVWHVENLLIIQSLLDKKDDIAKSARLHPFVVRKGVAQLKHRSHKSLANAFSVLCSIDEKTKGGRVKLETALFHFLLTR